MKFGRVKYIFDNISKIPNIKNKEIAYFVEKDKEKILGNLGIYKLVPYYLQLHANVLTNFSIKTDGVTITNYKQTPPGWFKLTQTII